MRFSALRQRIFGGGATRPAAEAARRRPHHAAPVRADRRSHGRAGRDDDVPARGVWLRLADTREAQRPAHSLSVHLRVVDEVLQATDRQAYPRAVRILKRARTAARKNAAGLPDEPHIRQARFPGGSPETAPRALTYVVVCSDPSCCHRFRDDLTWTEARVAVLIHPLVLFFQ